MSKQQLKVDHLPPQDRWKDMARVPHRFRIDRNGNKIHRATICKVAIGDKSTLLVSRGCPEDEAIIQMDSPTRDDLGVKVGDIREVELHPVWVWGYCRWAWNADDPAYRFPAQFSLISLFLGVVGLLLGVLPLFVH